MSHTLTAYELTTANGGTVEVYADTAAEAAAFIPNSTPTGNVFTSPLISQPVGSFRKTLSAAIQNELRLNAISQSRF